MRKLGVYILNLIISVILFSVFSLLLSGQGDNDMTMIFSLLIVISLQASFISTLLIYTKRSQRN